MSTISGSQPRARVSFIAMWYDGVGRQIGVADYGTNGDSALSRPDATPARSDTVLVSTSEYNSAGEAYKSIDPKGKEDRSTFDHAGRRIKLVEAWDDGDYSTGDADRDRTTEWTYTADGQVATMTARNPNTASQVTRYVYGTTTTESGVGWSDLLRAVIYPDSDDVEDPERPERRLRIRSAAGSLPSKRFGVGSSAERSRYVRTEQQSSTRCSAAGSAREGPRRFQPGSAFQPNQRTRP